jgi:GNAT superfamily N-acetyltransferase
MSSAQWAVKNLKAKRLSVIRKANPYRDEFGRFTSQDKAVTVVGEKSGLSEKKKTKGLSVEHVADWLANKSNHFSKAKLLGERGWLGDLWPRPITFSSLFGYNDGNYNGQEIFESYEGEPDEPLSGDFETDEEYDDAFRLYESELAGWEHDREQHVFNAFDEYKRDVEQYIEQIIDTSIGLDGKKYEATARVKIAGGESAYRDYTFDDFTLHISLSDLDEDGMRVGYVMGQLETPGWGGPPVIDIGSMQIEPSYQQKGIATTFLAHWQDQAARAGIERVEFSAASGGTSNGAYTWATLGGIPETRYAAEDIANGFRGYYYDETGTEFDINFGISGIYTSDSNWEERKRKFFPLMFHNYGKELREYLLTGYGDWQGYFEPFEMNHDWLDVGEDFITLPDGNVVPLEKSSSTINDVIAWWANNDPAAMERGDPKFWEEMYEATNRPLSKSDPHWRVKNLKAKQSMLARKLDSYAN